MARTSSLRASDADRDAVAERLHRAAVEGRLDHEELEQRLHAALRARTYGDLRALVADLPSQPAVWQGPRTGVMPLARIALAVAVRVAIVLVAVAVVVTVAAFTAAWWILWALVWMSLRTRRGRGGAWRPPPRRIRLG
jgi:hypothetical protein